jgi:hypothetical protein
MWPALLELMIVLVFVLVVARFSARSARHRSEIKMRTSVSGQPGQDAHGAPTNSNESSGSRDAMRQAEGGVPQNVSQAKEKMASTGA